MEAQEDGWGNVFIGFTMLYKQTTTMNPDAYLVFKTSDPASPTLRIPIVRSSGYSRFVDDSREVWLQIKPNPIRLDQISSGNTQVVEIGVMGNSLSSEKRIMNVAFSTIGGDFSISEITDNLGNSLTNPLDIDIHVEPIRVFLEYHPQDDQPENGLLAITFKDSWGLTQNLRVPILVGKGSFDVRTVFLYFQDDFLDLDTARTESSFDHNPELSGWDLKVGEDYHVIHNRENGVEVAYLEGCPFEAATTIDARDTAFTSDLLGITFEGNIVILIKTDQGEIYKLGNPIAGEFGLRFQYAPLE
jgi:hypothetical protein